MSDISLLNVKVSFNKKCIGKLCVRLYREGEGDNCCSRLHIQSKATMYREREVGENCRDLLGRIGY